MIDTEVQPLTWCFRMQSTKAQKYNGLCTAFVYETNPNPDGSDRSLAVSVNALQRIKDLTRDVEDVAWANFCAR